MSQGSPRAADGSGSLPLSRCFEWARSLEQERGRWGRAGRRGTLGHCAKGRTRRYTGDDLPLSSMCAAFSLPKIATVSLSKGGKEMVKLG